MAKPRLRIPLALTYTVAASVACVTTASVVSCSDDSDPVCELYCLPDDEEPDNPCEVAVGEDTLCADIFENGECPARCRSVG